MSDVHLCEISVRFGSVTALREISLQISSGRYVAILGASGSGKTTLLRTIAGLTRPSSGDVRIGDHSVVKLAPRHRDVAFVPQFDGLYPHLTIRRSIEMGIKNRLSSGQIRERVSEAAEFVDMADLLDRYPQQLSGGQRRRAALAKAIASGAAVRLLDEPLSAIDANLRFQIEKDLRRIHQDFGATTLHVTHDAGEAARLADQIAVIDQGRCVQFDTPDALRSNPLTPAVAAVLGDSPFITARLRRDRDGWVSDCGQSFQPLSSPEPVSDRVTIGFYQADATPLDGDPVVGDWCDPSTNVRVPADRIRWFPD